MARKDAKTLETEKAPFPSRLSEIMKEQHVSQEKLANAIGVKRQTVSLYKTGQSSPNAEQLCKISKFFCVSVDWLLGISDVKGTNPDIKAIHEIIGLNEAALKSLIDLMQQNPYANYVSPITNVINQFLSIEIGRNVLFKISRLGIVRNESRTKAETKIENLKRFINSERMAKDDVFFYVADLRKELFAMEKNESYERFCLIDAFIKLLDKLYPVISWEDYMKICDSLDGMDDNEQ